MTCHPISQSYSRLLASSVVEIHRAIYHAGFLKNNWS